MSTNVADIRADDPILTNCNGGGAEPRHHTIPQSCYGYLSRMKSPIAV